MASPTRPAGAAAESIRPESPPTLFSKPAIPIGLPDSSTLVTHSTTWRRGELSWRWEYDYARSRAIFYVLVPAAAERPLHTRSAEDLVAAMYDAQGKHWLPAPHPGGERQLEEILKKMSDNHKRR